MNIHVDKVENQAVRHTLIDRVLNMSDSRVRYLAKVTPIDRFLDATFLKFIPDSISPNQITLFRFITIPVIIYLLLAGHNVAATTLFLFSAFSDALDGARARTHNRITSWGIICDPLADKLLIGTVSLIIVSKYVSVYLAIAIALIEIFMILSAYFRYKGKVVPAKTVAKIKMILQSLGLIFLMYFMLSGSPVMLEIARYTLYGSVVFALLSLFVYRSI